MKLVKKSKRSCAEVDAVVEAYSSEDTGSLQDAVDFVVSHLPNVHGSWPTM